MENNKTVNQEVMVNEQETKVAIANAKPRRRLNPIVKWGLIGGGAVIIVGGIVYCVVKGKKVPTEAVEKVAEVTAEVAAAI